MKKLLTICCAMLLSFSAIAGEAHSPIEFFRDLSLGTYTPMSNISLSYTTGGTYTNGIYTNFYRLNGTNAVGRLPVSGVTTSIWTGSASASNAVVLSWPTKGGVRRYVIEYSADNSNWTNWTTVAASYTNFTDTGTVAWTESDFTGTISQMPAATTPWSAAGALFTNVMTNSVFLYDSTDKFKANYTSDVASAIAAAGEYETVVIGPGNYALSGVQINPSTNNVTVVGTGMDVTTIDMRSRIFFTNIVYAGLTLEGVFSSTIRLEDNAKLILNSCRIKTAYTPSGQSIHSYGSNTVCEANYSIFEDALAAAVGPYDMTFKPTHCTYDPTNKWGSVTILPQDSEANAKSIEGGFTLAVGGTNDFTNGDTKVATPTEGPHAVTKDYADAASCTAVYFVTVKDVQQNFTNNVWTKVTWSNAVSSLGGGYSAADNRFVPPVNGDYYFRVWAYHGGTTANDHYDFHFYTNGVNHSGMRGIAVASTAFSESHADLIPDLTTNDYVEVYIKQNTGTTRPVYVNSDLTRWVGFLYHED